MAQRRKSGRASQANDLDSWRRKAIVTMTRSRAATLRFLAPLPESAIFQPRTQGEWSIKDVLGHFAAWEEEAIKRLDLIRRGHGGDIVFYDDMQAGNAFNARAVQRARRASYQALLRRMERVRQRLIDRLLQLPLASLNDPTHRYTVISWLPEFAWTHEQGHLIRMRQWQRQQPARRGGRQ